MQSTIQSGQNGVVRKRIFPTGQRSVEANVKQAFVVEAQKLLSTSSYRDLRSVKCSCQGRNLVLSGQVSSFYEKQIAQTLIKGVSGVKKIINNLEVVYPASSGEHSDFQTVRKTK